MAVSVVTVGCSGGPSKAELVTKLRQVNGLTETQATCVADAMFEQIDEDQLAAAAKPDNAGKVEVETITTMRTIIAECVPADMAN